MNELMRWIGDLQARIERLESLESGASSGTWTPTFIGLTTPGTLTYAEQVGRYRRIGDLVLCWCGLDVSAVSVAPTGTLALSGLPFTVANVGGINYHNPVGQWGNLNLMANYTAFNLSVDFGTTRARINQSGDNVVASLSDASIIGVGSNLYTTFWYIGT